MTDDQRRAIEWECTRLINCHALLTDAHQWDDVAALYTIAGTLIRPTAPDQPIVGRDTILAAFRARPPRVTRHACTNIVVTVDSETSARAESVILLFTGTAAPLVGTYHDHLILTPAGWRFSERRGALTFAP